MSRKPGYPLHRLIKERRAALGLSRTDVPWRMGLPQRQQGSGCWSDRRSNQMIVDPARIGLTREAIIVEAIERRFAHIRYDLRRGWIVTAWDAGPGVLAVLHEWAGEAAREP